MHPAKIQSSLKKAINLHQRNKYADAAKLYHAVLKSDPNNPDGLHYLGLLSYNQGNTEQAVVMILAALAINPSYVDAYLNLGNIYLGDAQFSNAQKCYEKALELSPNHLGVGSNLGILHRYKGELEKSEALLEEVVRLAPSLSVGYINLANTQMALKKGEHALLNFQQAITINPKDPSFYSMAIKASLMLRQTHKANVWVSQLMKIAPNDPSLKHLSAALSGDDIPVRASDAYVKATFDAYADTFESSLDRLDYCAPKLLEQKLEHLYQEKDLGLRVLDAGCGTGLAHSYLRPYASKLIGMDISSKMLDKARSKKSYDQLLCKSLELGISDYTGYFDLITCLDTIIYFGDLERLFNAVAESMSGDSYFIFTTEKHDGSQNYKLCLHGRYEHSRDYLEQRLIANNLSVVSIENCVARKEFGEDVEGWLVVAHKQA